MAHEAIIALVRERTMRNDHCPLWDLGPVRPTAPVPPTAPVKAGDDTEFALAQVKYEDGLEDYKKQLRKYGLDKREWDHWRQQVAGPIKIYHWATDVVRMCAEWPERYVMDLPKGIKPGRTQEENEEREANEEYERLTARKNDPQFGGVRA